MPVLETRNRQFTLRFHIIGLSSQSTRLLSYIHHEAFEDLIKIKKFNWGNPKMQRANREATKNTERRAARRTAYKTVAEYMNKSIKGEGTVKNISSDGMFLETRQLFEVGEKICIKLRFRHSKYPMNIIGEIARVVSGGVGVKFLWP